MILKNTQKLELNCDKEIEIEVNIKYNNIKEIILKTQKLENKKNIFVIKLSNETLINKQSIIKEILKNLYSNCLKSFKNNNNYEIIKNTNLIINNLQKILDLLSYLNYDEPSTKNITLNGVLIIKINLNKKFLLSDFNKEDIKNINILNINFIYIGMINNKQYHLLTDNVNTLFNINNFIY